jgi:hypothetical protein
MSHVLTFSSWPGSWEVSCPRGEYLVHAAGFAPGYSATPALERRSGRSGKAGRPPTDPPTMPGFHSAPETRSGHTLPRLLTVVAIAASGRTSDGMRAPRRDFRIGDLAGINRVAIAGPDAAAFHAERPEMSEDCTLRD